MGQPGQLTDKGEAVEARQRDQGNSEANQGIDQATQGNENWNTGSDSSGGKMSTITSQMDPIQSDLGVHTLSQKQDGPIEVGETWILVRQWPIYQGTVHLRQDWERCTSEEGLHHTTSVNLLENDWRTCRTGDILGFVLNSDIR
jgi:hypothetical protein